MKQVSDWLMTTQQMTREQVLVCKLARIVELLSDEIRAVPRPTIQFAESAGRRDLDDAAQMKVAEPTAFAGGTLAYFIDRVELCGVNICSGRRSQNRRNVLDALRERRNGRFVAYSQAELLAKTNFKGGDSIGGLIRDLRDQIQEKLLAVANIACGEMDVVLTDEEGYRLADSIKLSVQFDENKIQGHGEIKNEEADPVNAPDHDPVTAQGDPVNPERDPVNDKSDPVNVPVSADGDPVESRLPDPDDQVARRAWILEQIASGRRFRVPQIADEIGCSKETVKRDLDALGNQIEFVGAPKTGYYQIRPSQTDA